MYMSKIGSNSIPWLMSYRWWSVRLVDRIRGIEVINFFCFHQSKYKKNRRGKGKGSREQIKDSNAGISWLCAQSYPSKLSLPSKNCKWLMLFQVRIIIMPNIFIERDTQKQMALPLKSVLPTSGLSTSHSGFQHNSQRNLCQVITKWKLRN